MTQAYPLSWPEGWPRTKTAYRRTSSPFQTTFDKARRDLFHELHLLGVEHVIVSSNLPLRLDGMPRGDAARMKIDDPGVALYFTLRDRPMVMARDTYWTVHDNLRSIGLAVAHLRGLERHGGAYMMERAFQGFTALPPPENGGAPIQKPWREVLGPLPDGLEPSDLLILAESRYRAKSREHHPDANGGDGDQMIILNAAIAEARKEMGK